MYPTPTFAARCGMKLRTLRGWLDRGAIRPSGRRGGGRGRHHEFTEADLRVVIVARALLRKRVSFSQVVELNRALQDSAFHGEDYIVITPDGAKVVRGQRELRRALAGVRQAFVAQISALEEEAA